MKYLILILCLGIGLACGGGGGGAGGTAPEISDLRLSESVDPVGTGGGTVSINAWFQCQAGSGTPKSVQVTTQGAALTFPIVPDKGTIGPSIEGLITMDTSVIGDFPVQVQVFDDGGRGSNVLSTVFTVSAPAPVVASTDPLAVVSGGPAFALTVLGTGFSAQSAVQWNGAPKVTTYVSATELRAAITAQDIATAGTAAVSVANPLEGGAASSAFNLPVAGLGVTAVRVPANDLVWDPVHQLLLASLPSAAGAEGNSVALVDPVAGVVTRTVPVGHEPGRLALSGDGSFLYVGLDGDASIQRLTLPGLVADLTIPLPGGNPLGPTTVLDMQVAPGAPHTLAVSLGIQTASSRLFGGLFIYDDGTPRPVSIPGLIDAAINLDTLAWGADASTLYAANNQESEFDFYRLSVGASGAAIALQVPGAFSSFSSMLHYDPANATIYGDSGQALDPSTGNRLGTFTLSGLGTVMGPMLPDSTQGLAYLLDSTSYPPNTWTINTFLLATYTTQAALTFPMAAPGVYTFPPPRLIRWGTGALACGGAGAYIHLLQGPFLLGP